MTSKAMHPLAVAAALIVTGSSLVAGDLDDRIEASFKSSYVNMTCFKGDSIKAKSENGVVTLTGTVVEESHKALAAETAAKLPGVVRVDNQLATKVAVAAVLGGPLAPETPVECMEPSVLAAEVPKDEKPSRPPDQLYGTWVAKDVDAKMGEVKIRLTFRREERVSVLAWSSIPFVGKVRDLKGEFSVWRDTISSEAIGDGKKAKFSFENKQLVLRFKSGRIVRFDRE